MNITTNIEKLLPELTEEAKFFKNFSELEIVHRHIQSEPYIDEITINGKKYAYTNERKCNGETELKRYLKRYAKLSLYEALSDYLKEELPWGALTGIRPVKFAYDEGENWREEMGKVLKVKENKLDLVERIIIAAASCEPQSQRKE